MDESAILADYLSDQSLARLAGYVSFERGRSYYMANRVTLTHVSFDRIEAKVRGNLLYKVSLSMAGEQLDFSCSCPVGQGGYFCKHLVATAMQARSQVSVPPEVAWKRKLDWLIRVTTRTAEVNENSAAARLYILVFGLTQRYQSWELVPLRIYVNKNYQDEMGEVNWNDVQALVRFIQHKSIRKPDIVRSLGEFTYCLNADSGAYVLANLLISQYTSTCKYLEWFWRFPLALFYYSATDGLRHRLELHPTTEKAVMVVSKSEKGYDLNLALTMGHQLQPLSSKKAAMVQRNPIVLLVGNTLVQVSHPPALVLESLLEESALHIPAAFEAQFLDQYFVKIGEAISLVGEGVEYYEDVQPQPRLYLSEKNKELIAELRFAYLGKEVPYQKAQEYLVVPQSEGGRAWFIRRNRLLEDTLADELSTTRYGLKRYSVKEPGCYTLRAKVHILDFLAKFIPMLIADGFEIYGEERIKSVRLNRARPTLSLSISSGIDWLDLNLQVQFGDQVAPWKEVRAAIFKGQTYVKLADGSIGAIPPEWVRRFKKVFSLGKATERGLELSEAQLPLVDVLIAEAEMIQGFEEYRQRLQQLRDFERIEPQPLPQGFRGELRPYQKAGYDWLHFLYRYKLGGCLADDMGLGKTVQVLAFLQSLKERQEATAAHLLVVPKSLLINWQREAERFTPELRFLDYSTADRPKDLKAFDAVDVVLTTYGIVLRDIEKLRKYTFDTVILDESQAVKNPLAQSAKAVRLLNCRHRLVMTGTPIENNTFELWSQFAFLQPGLLGNLETFRREFAGPIEAEGDEETADTLRKLVHPFILRRTKAQVAPELPPREERLIYTQMGEEQQHLYRKMRDHYRALIMESFSSEMRNDQRMTILEGLLRLRQISIHPALVEPTFQGEAPKFTWLLETLETLQKEGHKALVFSQFVEALHLLQRELDNRSVRYAYLDGQTHNRQSQVDAFQNDPDLPFFLISLKAGGVGLNLTAADYVIHLDPWWNPAVERQAADRTHRIGQDKPVFIYKVIVRDTVEEKMLHLQEKKRQLVDQIIHAEGSIFKSLNREDLEVLFS